MAYRSRSRKHISHMAIPERRLDDREKRIERQRELAMSQEERARRYRLSLSRLERVEEIRKQLDRMANTGDKNPALEVDYKTKAVPVRRFKSGQRSRVELSIWEGHWLGKPYALARVDKMIYDAALKKFKYSPYLTYHDMMALHRLIERALPVMDDVGDKFFRTEVGMDKLSVIESKDGPMPLRERQLIADQEEAAQREEIREMVKGVVGVDLEKLVPDPVMGESESPEKGEVEKENGEKE